MLIAAASDSQGFLTLKYSETKLLEAEIAKVIIHITELHLLFINHIVHLSKPQTSLEI